MAGEAEATMRASREDLAWGLKWGLYMAVAFSVIVVPIKVLFGLEDEDFGLGSIILLYFAAGTLGGLVAGLFRQSVDSPRSAALPGFVGALVVYGTVLLP